jgi:hypothetical protein
MDTRYSTIGGETCQNCGRKYKLCWKAPDHIWMSVTGSDSGLLCIPCFDELAAAKGISLSWECALHPIYQQCTCHSDQTFYASSAGCPIHGVNRWGE